MSSIPPTSPAAPVAAMKALEILIQRQLAPLLVGIIVSAALYGVTLTQTLFYYASFPYDGLWVKSFVGTLWLLDTAHIFAAGHILYHYCVTIWGQPMAIDTIPVTIYITIFLTQTIAFCVQLYLIWRIFILGRSVWVRPLVLILGMTSLLAFASGIGYGVKLATLGLSSKIPEILFIIDLSLASAATVDILITVSLTLLLHFNRSGVKTTDDLINSVITYTINTGLLTSMTALLDVILHAASSNTTAYLAFYVILSKLYCNTLMGTLNARKLRIKGQRNVTYEESSNGTRLEPMKFNANATKNGIKMGLSSMGRSESKTVFDGISSLEHDATKVESYEMK